MGTCFVHIGTHKTGTSSIQALLWSNQAALSAAGVYVPKTGHPSDITDNAGHHNLAFELNGEERFNPADGSFDDLLAELEPVDKPAAVLSSELFGHLVARPAALDRLRRGLESVGYTPKIVAYLRPQSAYAQSLYLEIRKHGFSMPFGEYLDVLMKDGKIVKDEVLTYEFTYNRLLSVFAEHFGANRVTARRYLEESTPLLDDFISVVADEVPALSLEGLNLPPRMNENPHKDRFLTKLMESKGSEKLAQIEHKFSVDYVTALVRYGARQIEAV